MEVAPDLVVEVHCPCDRPGELPARVSEWLDAGARLVWVVDPLHVTASVTRSDRSETRLTAADNLYGEGVLPGFQCSVAAIAWCSSRTPPPLTSGASTADS